MHPSNHTDESAPEHSKYTDPHHVMVCFDVKSGNLNKVYKNDASQRDVNAVVGEQQHHDQSVHTGDANTYDGDTTQTEHTSDQQHTSSMTLTHADSTVFGTLVEQSEIDAQWNGAVYDDQPLHNPPPFNFDSVQVIHDGRSDCMCLTCTLAKSNSLGSHCDESNKLMCVHGAPMPLKDHLETQQGLSNSENTEEMSDMNKVVAFGTSSFNGSNASCSGVFAKRDSMDSYEDVDDLINMADEDIVGENNGSISLNDSEEGNDLEVLFSGVRYSRRGSISQGGLSYWDEHINWDFPDTLNSDRITTNPGETEPDNDETTLQSDLDSTDDQGVSYQFGTDETEEYLGGVVLNNTLS